MIDLKTTIESHTLHFKTSSTGSVSPWELDFANENNIPLIGTADICDFLLVDGDTVYKLKWNAVFKFEESNIKTWVEFQDWIKDNCERGEEGYSLKEAIEQIKRWK